MTTQPAELTIGLTDGTFYGGDPFPAFAWMREHAPAYFDESAGVWGITRYADVKEISKDPETFSNAGGIRPDSDALPDDDRHGCPRARAPAPTGERGVHPAAYPRERSRHPTPSATRSSTGSARRARPTSSARSPPPCR